MSWAFEELIAGRRGCRHCRASRARPGLALRERPGGCPWRSGLWHLGVCAVAWGSPTLGLAACKLPCGQQGAAPSRSALPAEAK